MEEPRLQATLQELSHRAKALRLTDAAWAALAGIPKETLSRLRRRSSCDFDSLDALANAIGMRICAVDAFHADGALFPPKVDRRYEESLIDLCASGDLDLTRWRSFGPPFFMAGLATMLASTNGVNRRGLLELAERLHAGISEPFLLNRWLESTPIRPSRFLPMVDARLTHAA